MACNSPTDALTPSDARFPGCDPAKPRHVLRISFDDPGTAEEDRTYLPFESRLRSWDVNGGRDSELDTFDATTAEYVLDDRDRALDPTNASSVYAPDIVPNRMIWHRIDVDGATYDVFKGYIDGWGPEWPVHGVGDHTARIRASDGKKLLRLAAFTSADPDVLDYPDVIGADQPSFYYRLGEPSGTKVVHHVRKKKRKHESRRHFTRHRRRSEEVTIAEVEGMSGPAGTYKNTPTLGQPGIIAGDADTCVLFQAANSEYARIGPLDASDVVEGTSIAIEAWINFASLHGSRNRNIVAGPFRTSDAVEVWYLAVDNTGNLVLSVDGAERVASTTTLSPNTWYHVYADSGPAVSGDPSNTGAVYINGVLDNDTVTGNVPLAAGDANEFIRIGGAASGTSNSTYWDGYLDEVAIYEHRLSAARVLAHYEAGLLGFGSGGVGQRIEDILTLASTPASWEIQSGERTMPPDRYAGVQPLDMVERAVAAEGEPSTFYFTSTNVPRFFGSDYRSSPPYDTPRFSFGGSNVKFEDTVVDPDDSFLFNDIRGTTEDGDKTFRAEDATSITRYGRLTLPLNSLPIDNDADIQSYVDALLARYKDPLVRVPSFRLTGADASRREAMLSLELGDCVAISVPIPGGGSPLDQTSYIERRHLWQEQSSSVIRGEFSISPR